jgi:hypothetical protein
MITALIVVAIFGLIEPRTGFFFLLMLMIGMGLAG